MTTLRIVKFETGQFAVQKRQNLRWGFCGVKDDYVWLENRNILEYCMLPTLFLAEESLEYICIKIKASRNLPIKIPRIVRVIKKVKV